MQVVIQHIMQPGFVVICGESILPPVRQVQLCELLTCSSYCTSVRGKLTRSALWKAVLPSKVWYNTFFPSFYGVFYHYGCY